MAHNWVALLQVPLNEEEAAGFINDKDFPDIGGKDIQITGVGCTRCERPLTLEIFKQECRPNLSFMKPSILL